MPLFIKMIIMLWNIGVKSW